MQLWLARNPMGRWRAIQQRIASVEIPHFITHSLALFVRDSAKATVRGACQFAEVNLILDRVEVDPDEIKIHGKVSGDLHHGFKIHWLQMWSQFLLRNIAFENCPILPEGGAPSIRGDDREIVVEAAGPVIAKEAVIPRHVTVRTSQQLFDHDLRPDETIVPFSGNPTETSFAQLIESPNCLIDIERALVVYDLVPLAAMICFDNELLGKLIE